MKIQTLFSKFCRDFYGMKGTEPRIRNAMLFRFDWQYHFIRELKNRNQVLLNVKHEDDFIRKFCRYVIRNQ